MDCRQVDEEDGCSRRYQGKAAEDDDPGQEAALPTGQGKPPVPRARAEHAVGFRLSLRGHLERVRLSRFRHRRQGSYDRWLARQHLPSCRARSPRPQVGRP